jgi:pilus assembly protein CpaB
MLRLVLLLFALLSGGAAAWLVIAHGRPPPAVAVVQATPVAPAPPMPDVLVASSELRSGQPLGKENMRWQPWPENAVNPVYITRSVQPDALETLSGALVRSRMSIGEPIREENLAPRNAGFLAAILPSGKRALAVRISAENTAGGFILPNDRVDVLHTEGEHLASRTILRNIPVLAIDQIVDERKKDEKGKATVIGKTATLELDPVQAELLTAAQAKGTLSLSLRSAADNDDNSKPSSRVPHIIRAGRSEMVKTQY